MPLTVHIDTDPHQDGISLFARDEIEIDAGVTILCGCNGAGKTTLLTEIARNLGYMTEHERRIARLAKAVNDVRNEHALNTDNGEANDEGTAPPDTCNRANDEQESGKPQPTVLIWNAVKGREGFMENAARTFDPADIAYGFDIQESSEGEGTMLALGRFGRDIAQATARSEAGAPIVLLIDAVDSGLDEANMKEFREFMGFVSEQTINAGHDFYLVITTNSWPMTQEWDNDAKLHARCVLVPSIEQIDVSKYETWRKIMLKGAREKRKRDKKVSR